PDDGTDAATKQAQTSTSINEAVTVAEVERIRDQVLAEFAAARAEMTDVPGVEFGVGIGLDVGEQAVRNEAERRIREIEEALAAGEPVKVGGSIDLNDTIRFGDGPPW